MSSRNSYRWLVGFIALSLMALAARAEDKKSEDAYRNMIDERTAKAIKDKDVPTLVECAFALYPLETTAKVKNPKYQELLVKAAEAVLEKKDAKEAGLFLEMAGPLTGTLKSEQRNNLETLARGKSIDEIAAKQAEVARGGTKTVGPALADPEAKPRGDDLKQAAEALGKGLVETVRYTDTPILKTYSMNDGTLKVTMEWAGVITGLKYTSKIEFEFEKEGGKLKIKNIYYSDDALTKSDPYYVEKFRRQFNSK